MAALGNALKSLGRWDHQNLAIVFCLFGCFVVVYAERRTQNTEENNKRSVLAISLVIGLCLSVAGVLMAEAARNNSNAALVSGITSVFGGRF